MKVWWSLVCGVLALALAGAATADEYRNVEVKKLVTSSTASNGQPLAYLQTDKPEVSALIVTIPPGGETGWHQHPVPVYAYVLEGELTVQMKDGAKYSFKQGEAVLEVMNTLHNGFNAGGKKVALVVFYTGAVGVPNVVKEPPSVPASH
jgi:quercetin dioxygenase-like cupin family protein